jgi:hypothetical protein
VQLSFEGEEQIRTKTISYYTFNENSKRTTDMMIEWVLKSYY